MGITAQQRQRQRQAHRGLALQTDLLDKPRRQMFGRIVLLLMLLLLGLAVATPAGAATAAEALQQRLEAWPAWSLPALWIAPAEAI